MKLAEALQERADLNRNIEQLKMRLNKNVLVQERETPAELPARLKQELDASVDRLEYLMAKINKTNHETAVDGKTLTELISEKDALSIKISAYKEIVSAASLTVNRARNSEIRIRSSISVTGWQTEIDNMSKKLRIVDNKLQETNWKTELIE